MLASWLGTRTHSVGSACHNADSVDAFSPNDAEVANGTADVDGVDGVAVSIS